jgi:hypothetical protein
MSKEIRISRNGETLNTLTNPHEQIGYESKDKRFKFIVEKTREGGEAVILTDIGQIDQHTIEVTLTPGSSVRIKDLNNLKVTAK